MYHIHAGQGCCICTHVGWGGGVYVSIADRSEGFVTPQPYIFLFAWLAHHLTCEQEILCPVISEGNPIALCSRMGASADYLLSCKQIRSDGQGSLSRTDELSSLSLDTDHYGAWTALHYCFVGIYCWIMLASASHPRYAFADAWLYECTETHKSTQITKGVS